MFLIIGYWITQGLIRWNLNKNIVTFCTFSSDKDFANVLETKKIQIWYTDRLWSSFQYYQNTGIPNRWKCSFQFLIFEGTFLIFWNIDKSVCVLLPAPALTLVNILRFFSNFYTLLMNYIAIIIDYEMRNIYCSFTGKANVFRYIMIKGENTRTLQRDH